ncbi:hypothetical protein CCC_03358 [Paramagnetospirillum magnetotacticum MS-1]|uniref:Uncharacterized protein n=1 Tax=Paramagnetospirillum magnetotacticum MS-1 TaxID=272627 RepID=A0A0C2YWU5_PARME|nr:hypothetical protein [Paramagnetospirillum magnetotacticum]KIL99140.1 hypothetical protein CCC_03358 [Paramagnetospirillum magnetotacticum MS-1]
MRRLVALIFVLLASACYQVDGETVAASASIRVDGVKDGRYRRPDGVEVRVRWNEGEKQYDVASPDGPTGKARAARLAPGLFLVQYLDAARLTLMAAPKGDDVVLFFADKVAEPRLLKAHGLGLKPGPINALTGPARAVADFYKDLAVSGEFREGERLIYLGG